MNIYDMGERGGFLSNEHCFLDGTVKSIKAAIKIEESDLEYRTDVLMKMISYTNTLILKYMEGVDDVDKEDFEFAINYIRRDDNKEYGEYEDFDLERKENILAVLIDSRVLMQTELMLYQYITMNREIEEMLFPENIGGLS